jgi:nicotinate phosphoribosyltransferase
MPNNCIFLVDTYNSIQGIKHAIQVGKNLQKHGKKLLGIRLDSGDIASLSQKARAMLDKEGFENTKIVASNSLSEMEIHRLKAQGAKIDVWGIGTHLVTAFDQPALDGVYKLSALKNENGEWQYKIKVSEQSIKISNPGILQVKRYSKQGLHVADMLYDIHSAEEHPVQFAPYDVLQRLPEHDQSEDLLKPVVRKGQVVLKPEPLSAVRERTIKAITQFTTKAYPVGLEKNTEKLRQALLNQHCK